MADDLVVPRTKDGKFPKGVSGNPLGRPKGSKNQITLLKQSLELKLREEAAPDMAEVLKKAVALALEGNTSMIKLLLELHMTKNNAEDKEAKEKVEINIGGITQKPDVKRVSVINEEDIEDAEISE